MSTSFKRSVGGRLKEVVDFFVTILFPSVCAGCKKEGAVLCENCLSSPFATKTPFPWIRSIYLFKTPIGRALKDAKYRHYHAVLEHITTHTQYLFDEYVSHIQGEEVLVVPIPQTRNRTQKRGFNQAEIIAKQYREKSNCKNLFLTTRTLQKIKETVPQASIRNREERLKNIVGSFVVAEDVAGKTILLIDDVTTTGATLSEARTTLLRAGAKEVFVFTIAH